MTLHKSLLAVPAAAGLAVLALPGTASADGDYRINLKDTMGNGSESSGTAHVSIQDDEMTVRIKGTGFTPNSPHAQHFHGSFSSNTDFTCPTSAADKDGDGQVTTEEGLPTYGDIMISLTTKGDTSPKSGLAVDRMPKADAEGNLTYERTIKLPGGAGAKIRNLHIVQHGLDANGNDKYDAEALGESTFAKAKGVDSIPEEATNPATCGTVQGAAAGAPPTGGVETGDGSTAGVESVHLLALGGLALTGTAGAVVLRRRMGTL